MTANAFITHEENKQSCPGVQKPYAEAGEDARPVTGPYRRHMTFGRGVCYIQTGTSEFKLAGRSECTATIFVSL